MLRYKVEAADDSSLRHWWTDWDRISSHVAVAVIAAEDQRFFTHRGFDVDSIQEALADAERNGRLRGASTISQQVSKNLFLWPGRSIIRKGLEAYCTVFVELLWSKQRILEVYLNVAEFGPGVFGIAAASEYFFNTVPAQITADQAALLAAVLPNPKVLRVDQPSAVCAPAAVVDPRTDDPGRRTRDPGGSARPLIKWANLSQVRQSGSSRSTSTSSHPAVANSP